VSNADGAELWQDFVDDANAALSVKFTLKPGETMAVPSTLGWDLPTMQFGAGLFCGTSGGSAWSIARCALAHYPEWKSSIDTWQAPILADTRTPTWYKTALFMSCTA